MRSRLSLVVLAAVVFVAGAAPAAQAAKCDPIDPRACLLPWPNNYFTKVDKSMPNGIRLDLSAKNMPKNTKGQPIDMSAFAGNDGFSPGASIMTQVPGVDLAKTGVVPIDDIGQYTKKNAPVVVIDTTTGKRWPIWVERNSRAVTAKDESLEAHPAKNWLEGHRYVVALRNMKTADGKIIAPNKAFRTFIDGKATGSRAKSMESIFKTLAKAGIKRSSLYLAWDFTVESEKNLTSRALTMRDDAFKQLGDTNLADNKIPAGSRSPAFSITKVTNLAPCDPSGCRDGQDDEIARQVEGVVDVPCYLDQKGCPAGASMHYKKGTWTPQQIPGNVYQAPFSCNIPRRAFDAPVKPSLYGHGLLGSPTEINQGQLQRMSQDHGYMFCATPEIGMSAGDVPNAVKILTNFSTFNTFPDRLQQGMIAGLYLGRAMIHPKGFAANPAFQTSAGTSVIDTSHLYYDGNSQGGIFGGALTALSPDFTRAVLGVTGMNYSLLVWRSTDFSSYLGVAASSYPDVLDRELIVNVMQSLWDRGEANGYAEQMTNDPLPNTPKHTVLMHVGFGDHQVSQWAAEVEARTIGAGAYRPAYDPGRSSEKTPLWGIPALNPHGSGMVIWDAGPKGILGSIAGQNEVVVGTDPPLLTNLAPVTGTDGEISQGKPGQPPAGTYIPAVIGNGEDPHELPRNTPAARQQKADFLSPNGTITDQCGGKPCHSVQVY